MENLISIKDKIFIAGANGMVGSAIKRNLISNGYGDKSEGGAILSPPKKDLNLLEYNDVKSWFENNNPHVVIIAAAKVGGIVANSTSPLDFILENIKIQTNLIELSYLNKVRRLLFLGSSCIYPKNSIQPIKEEYLLQGELEKTNQWYAIAKISGIKLCQAYRIQKSFDAISLMPTNLYGPGDNYNLKNSHVMAALIRKFYEAKENKLKKVVCWGNGSPLREFLHVDDLAQACKYVLERWNPPYKEYESGKENLPYLNVGTGQDISIRDLAFKISKKIGFKGQIIWDKEKPNGTYKKQLDISRIKSIGWEPCINLDSGIDKAIDSFINEKKNLNLKS